MYSDNVVSLCYVSSQNDKTTQLCRIADYHNGGFEAYTYDSTYDFRGTERDLLYGYRRDISGGIGTIAVYDWSAYQDAMTNEWRTSTHESEVSWIEVISSFKDTPEQLVEMIKCGIKLSMPSSRKHDIIVCCSAKGAYADTVYVSANDLVCINDVYTFSDEVITLETAICPQCAKIINSEQDVQADAEQAFQQLSHLQKAAHMIRSISTIHVPCSMAIPVAHGLMFRVIS